MTLNGKVALVTGVSRGIGAAVAHRLADAGVKLGLASRSGADLGLPDAVAQPLRERGIRCTNVCPGGVATNFALEPGRGRTQEALAGMMSADDVADVVLFVLTRPRNHRILETAFRPMTEASWG